MMAGKHFLPFQIMEIEISGPLRDLRPPDKQDDRCCPGVLLFVRLHGHPLGVIEQTLDQAGMTAGQLAGMIWQELGAGINEHLLQDGLPRVDALDASGLAAPVAPACQVERAEFLANAPYVSIIVATHNRLDTLTVCLRSLLDMNYPDFDIVVVDNAPSNSSTEEYIHREFAGSSKVRYTREDHPGLACAHNRGLAETSAPYVAITDDDILADRYWLAALMQGFFRTDKVGCVTGMIFPAEIETDAQYWIEHAAGFAKGFSRRMYNLAEHKLTNPLFPYTAGIFGSGANMAFDVTALKATGGFDDGLGAGSIALGGDDLASFFQIIAGGYTLVYEPAAIIYHYHHREYDRLRKTAYGYGAGLTAYLTKAVIDRPARIFDIARKIPYGLYHALNPRSPMNVRKAEDYPRELTRIERKGMLAGPFLYLRSRWHTRRLRRRQERNREKIRSIETTERRL